MVNAESFSLARPQLALTSPALSSSQLHIHPPSGRNVRADTCRFRTGVQLFRRLAFIGKNIFVLNSNTMELRVQDLEEEQLNSR